jgi:peroxiredoxin
VQQTIRRFSRCLFVPSGKLEVLMSIGLVVSLLCLKQPAVRAPFVSVEAGMSAPEFSLSSAQGDAYHLADLQGQVVVLSFINTRPLDDSLSTPDLSRSQIVFLKSIAQQYAAQGVQVLLADATALVYGEPPDQNALRNFVYNWDIETIPLLMDKGTVAQAYGVSQVPTTFLITPDGRVTQRWDGVATAAHFALAVQSLVGLPDADADATPASHSAQEGANR